MVLVVENAGNRESEDVWI